MQQLTSSSVIGIRRQRPFARFSRARDFVTGEKVRPALVLTFFAAHVPLALLMANNEKIATLHAVATLAVAVWFAFSAKVERVIYAAAYITGAEVLWRMTEASAFWEAGKYGIALILIIAILRNWRVRPSILPVLYFLVLLPSAVLTLQNSSFSEARSLLSGNLSGPFALMIAACFFSQVSLSKEQLLRLFLALIGPIIGIASAAVFGITTAESLVFTSESNFETSGGFGPNQVSSVLGLGVLVSFLILLQRVDLKLKLICGLIMLFLGAQSALTFSRGGLYNVAGSILLASLFLVKDSRTRTQFLLAIILISTVSYLVILPRLDRFTGGALSQRFEDTGMTNRGETARMDLEIWLNNPILGVGPGVAKEHRSDLGQLSAAHTELTRLLAEHGVLGLIALLILAGAAARNYMLARRPWEKALVVAFMAWSFLFMMNAAMRLAAPAFIYGLTFALVVHQRKALRDDRVPPEALPLTRRFPRFSTRRPSPQRPQMKTLAAPTSIRTEV